MKMVVYIVLKKVFLSFLVVWHRSISRIKSIFFFEESIELEVLDNIYRNMRTYSIWLKWLPSCCSEIDGIEDNFVSLISKESLTENLKSKLARFQHFWEIYIQIEEQTCKNIFGYISDANIFDKKKHPKHRKCFLKCRMGWEFICFIYLIKIFFKSYSYLNSDKEINQNCPFP